MKLDIDMNTLSWEEISMLVDMKRRNEARIRAEIESELAGGAMTKKDIVITMPKIRKPRSDRGVPSAAPVSKPATTDVKPKKQHAKGYRAKKWTKNEFETLLREQRNGSKPDKIARMLGRSNFAVYTKLNYFKNNTNLTRTMKSVLKDIKTDKIEVLPGVKMPRKTSFMG